MFDQIHRRLCAANRSALNPITAGLTSRDIRNGRYDAAARRLEKYVSKRPADAHGYLLLAKCHWYAHRYLACLEAARAGLDVAPDDHDLLIEGARAADAAGHVREAYELAGRLLETEMRSIPIPRGRIASLVGWLAGSSVTEATASANQDAIRDFDWARRYRKKVENSRL